ncbi:MAG: hypothetical protein LBT22_09085 [Peptococcaceae bacterium]|jgi:hypothetical protein|nr:hypothetical protein [Peptococcaceae bacterium]
MLSKQEEVNAFLRDFEKDSLAYLAAKGVSRQDLSREQLELKWKLLHTILQQHPLIVYPEEISPYKNYRAEIKQAAKSAQVTIA